MSFRMACTLSKQSSWIRYRLVSLAKRVVISLSFRPGMLIPWSILSFHSLQARGSMARLKMGHERGSPCRTPLETWKGLLRMPLIAMCVAICWYRDFIVSMKGFGMLKALSVSYR
jgi:hypothetical protein